MEILPTPCIFYILYILSCAMGLRAMLLTASYGQSRLKETTVVARSSSLQTYSNSMNPSKRVQSDSRIELKNIIPKRYRFYLSKNLRVNPDSLNE